MERLEAGVVTREFQTVISVFSLRRIVDEERGKERGRWEGASPCRVTRVFQRVTNVSDSKLVRSRSFLPVVLVVSCKSLVSRNTWNSCVGRVHCPEKPCNHLLLFHPRRVQLSPPSIENPLRFFSLSPYDSSVCLFMRASLLWLSFETSFWKLIFMELFFFKNITLVLKITLQFHCGYCTRYLTR